MVDPILRRSERKRYIPSYLFPEKKAKKLIKATQNTPSPPISIAETPTQLSLVEISQTTNTPLTDSLEPPPFLTSSEPHHNQSTLLVSSISTLNGSLLSSNNSSQCFPSSEPRISHSFDPLIQEYLNRIQLTVNQYTQLLQDNDNDKENQSLGQNIETNQPQETNENYETNETNENNTENINVYNNITNKNMYNDILPTEDNNEINQEPTPTEDNINMNNENNSSQYEYSHNNDDIFDHNNTNTHINTEKNKSDSVEYILQIDDNHKSLDNYPKDIKESDLTSDIFLVLRFFPTIEQANEWIQTNLSHRCYPLPKQYCYACIQHYACPVEYHIVSTSCGYQIQILNQHTLILTPWIITEIPTIVLQDIDRLIVSNSQYSSMDILVICCGQLYTNNLPMLTMLQDMLCNQGLIYLMINKIDKRKQSLLQLIQTNLLDPTKELLNKQDISMDNNLISSASTTIVPSFVEPLSSMLASSSDLLTSHTNCISPYVSTANKSINTCYKQAIEVQSRSNPFFEIPFDDFDDIIEDLHPQYFDIIEMIDLSQISNPRKSLEQVEDSDYNHLTTEVTVISKKNHLGSSSHSRKHDILSPNLSSCSSISAQNTNSSSFHISESSSKESFEEYRLIRDVRAKPLQFPSLSHVYEWIQHQQPYDYNCIEMKCQCLSHRDCSHTYLIREHIPSNHINNNESNHKIFLIYETGYHTHEIIQRAYHQNNNHHQNNINTNNTNSNKPYTISLLLIQAICHIFSHKLSHQLPINQLVSYVLKQIPNKYSELTSEYLFFTQLNIEEQQEIQNTIQCILLSNNKDNKDNNKDNNNDTKQDQNLKKVSLIIQPCIHSYVLLSSTTSISTSISSQFSLFNNLNNDEYSHSFQSLQQFFSSMNDFFNIQSSTSFKLQHNINNNINIHDIDNFHSYDEIMTWIQSYDNHRYYCYQNHCYCIEHIECSFQYQFIPSFVTSTSSSTSSSLSQTTYRLQSIGQHNSQLIPSQYLTFSLQFKQMIKEFLHLTIINQSSESNSESNPESTNTLLFTSRFIQYLLNNQQTISSLCLQQCYYYLCSQGLLLKFQHYFVSSFMK